MTQQVEQQVTRVLEKKQLHLGQVIRENKNDMDCEQVIMVKYQVEKTFQGRNVVLIHQQKLTELQIETRNLNVINFVKQTFSNDTNTMASKAQAASRKAIDIKIEVFQLDKPHSTNGENGENGENGDSPVVLTSLENFYSIFNYVIKLLWN